MNAFVQWRRGVPYEHIFLRSYFELTGLVRRKFPKRFKVRSALLTAQDYQYHLPRWRRLAELYVRLSQSVIFRPLLTLFGPFLDIIGSPFFKEAPHGSINANRGSE